MSSYAHVLIALLAMLLLLYIPMMVSAKSFSKEMFIKVCVIGLGVFVVIGILFT